MEDDRQYEYDGPDSEREPVHEEPAAMGEKPAYSSASSNVALSVNGFGIPTKSSGCCAVTVFPVLPCPPQAVAETAAAIMAANITPHTRLFIFLSIILFSSAF